MIIPCPNDSRSLLYHVVDLNGQTVHAYRDLGAALQMREDDQRIFIQYENTGNWLTDAPCPAPVTRPVLRPSAVPDLKGSYGPEIYFDPQGDAEWPEGCWACRIPECDTYLGATPDEALAAWEAGQAPHGKPAMSKNPVPVPPTGITFKDDVTFVTMPCISLLHLSASTQVWIGSGGDTCFMYAAHDNGFFLTVPACTAQADDEQRAEFTRLPYDLQGVFHRMQPLATHGWFMVDVDGDVVTGLPIY